MNTIQIDKSLFNQKYLQYINCTKRFQLYYGGAGSGKSVFISQKLLMYCLSNTNKRILVARKWGKHNRQSTFAQLKDTIYTWNLSSLFEIRQSDMLIRCKHTNSQFIFSGLDDVQKLKSITNIRIIWVQQASQITKQDYLQLNLRLRGNSRKGCDEFQMIMSFNPVTNNHWIKKYFFDRNNDTKSTKGWIDINNVVSLKTTYLDNRFIDEAYKTQLEQYKFTSPYHYKVYTLGQWGTFGQSVYTNWEVVDFDKQQILNSSKNICTGMDFGYNDPTVALLCSEKDKDIYIIQQIYKRKITNTDLQFQIKQNNLISKYKIYADSAQPQRIQQLYRNGIDCHAISKKTIKQGINNLKTRKIIVHPSCINTIEQLQLYQYKKDERTGNYTDQIIEQNDHCMDALRYATQQMFVELTPVRIGSMM